MAKILTSDSITLVRVDDGAQGTQGINLILQSGIEYSNSSYPTHVYDLSEDIDPNETYTITIWGELGEGKTGFTAHIGGGYNYFPPSKKIATGKYQITGKLSISSGHENDRKDKLYVYPIPNSVTGKISTIHRVKLERGSVPDPVWTPSPLDADTKIEEFRLTVDTKLDEFQHTEDEFRSQLSEVTTTVTAAKADVEAAKERLDGTEKSIADAEGRLDGLDATVESVNAKTSKIEQQAGSIELSVQEVTEKATQLGTDISSAQSSIKQLSDSITNKVSKGDLSSEISQEAGAINIQSNRLTIESDNFKLTADGKVTANAVNLTGQFASIDNEAGRATYIRDGSIAVFEDKKVIMQGGVPTDHFGFFGTNGISLGILSGSTATPYYTVLPDSETESRGYRNLIAGGVGVSGKVYTDGGFVGNLTGLATKASADSNGKSLVRYIWDLSISGNTLTVTEGGGQTKTLTLPSGGGGIAGNIQHGSGSLRGFSSSESMEQSFYFSGTMPSAPSVTISGYFTDSSGTRLMAAGYADVYGITANGFKVAARRTNSSAYNYYFSWIAVC